VTRFLCNRLYLRCDSQCTVLNPCHQSCSPLLWGLGDGACGSIFTAGQANAFSVHDIAYDGRLRSMMKAAMNRESTFFSLSFTLSLVYSFTVLRLLCSLYCYPYHLLHFHTHSHSTITLATITLATDPENVFMDFFDTVVDDTTSECQVREF
jgi:hypothetical protein